MLYLIELRERAPERSIFRASPQGGNSGSLAKEASKLYMGKDFVMPPGWEHVGRFWGIIGRADLPLSACETFVEPSPVMIRFRRIVRRFLRAKRLTRRSRGAVRLFTEQHLQWVRVLDWASGIPLVPLEEVLAATAAKRSAEYVPPKHAEV